LPDTNPYSLLKVPRDADDDEIAEAYNRLFDKYEPNARAGDRSAIDMLEKLNEAHDVLTDPRQRARLDARLSAAPSRAASVATATAPAKPRNAQEQVIRTRRRSTDRMRTVQAGPRLPILPIAIATVLVLALLASVLFFLGRTQPPPPVVSKGTVVAIVNDQPIYEREFNRRVDVDKQIALSDPFFGAMFNNFQGITGTRALDTLRSDSLDKLVNLQVITQQARKEGVYPSAEEQKGLIEEAKRRDLAGGGSFQSLLAQRGISEEEYNQDEINRIVYLVMANDHMPTTGSDDERTDAFLKWICDTRKSYDVKVLLTFSIDNPTCTSGLPIPELPLPGLSQGTQVPEPESTTGVPAAVPTATK
jgi:curved DNA-binding protein CbpA